MTTSTDVPRGVPLTYVPDYLGAAEADTLFEELLERTPWAQKHTISDGRSVPMSRLICWIGESGYQFYGASIEAQPWTPTLARLRDRLDDDTGTTFNSVLLNLYRDGADAIGWHCDDEATLGTEPTIASLSLGSSRTFRMRRIRDGYTVELGLEHGSLAVMYGESQSAWEHSIPATSSVAGPRINLTFRRSQDH